MYTVGASQTSRLGLSYPVRVRWDVLLYDWGFFIFCYPLFLSRRIFSPRSFFGFIRRLGVNCFSFPLPLFGLEGVNILWLITDVTKRKTKITMRWLLGWLVGWLVGWFLLAGFCVWKMETGLSDRTQMRDWSWNNGCIIVREHTHILSHTHTPISESFLLFFFTSSLIRWYPQTSKHGWFS